MGRRTGRYPKKEISITQQIINFILDGRNSRRHPASFAKSKRGWFRRQERKFVRSYCQINGEMVLNDDTWEPVQRAIAAKHVNKNPHLAALEQQYGYGRSSYT